jgi:hypothetical protein
MFEKIIATSIAVAIAVELSPGQLRRCLQNAGSGVFPLAFHLFQDTSLQALLDS